MLDHVYTHILNGKGEQVDGVQLLGGGYGYIFLVEEIQQMVYVRCGIQLEVAVIRTYFDVGIKVVMRLLGIWVIFIHIWGASGLFL